MTLLMHCCPYRARSHAFRIPLSLSLLDNVTKPVHNRCINKLKPHNVMMMSVMRSLVWAWNSTNRMDTAGSVGKRHYLTHVSRSNQSQTREN
jgi:hypothetical protein